uniref:Uncharacterized protein n=1 Tax=Salix viminalis TaxID=40686 RepID=A0A6N2M8K3_SALVM
MSSPITIVSDESTVDDTSLHLKSTETSGSSQTDRIPLSSFSALSLKAAFTSSAKVFLETWTTRSTTETFGVGTRRAIPLSFPLREGRTRATALAAPVEVGTILRAAALARLRSRWLASSSLWSPRVKGKVPADLITKLLVKNLDKGSQAVSGARSIADDRFIGAVGVSIDSDNVGWYITLSGGCDDHLLGPCYNGRSRGLRLETTLMTLPSTEMALSPTGLTSASKMPRVESYLRRCEACLTPPVSLMAMTSRGESLRPCQHLKKFLPILPNPFMATFSFASAAPFLYPPLLLLPNFTHVRIKRNKTKSRSSLHVSEDNATELTAEVWKATAETKSSDVFLAKGRKADELRRPEKSVNPFPLACIKPSVQEAQEFLATNLERWFGYGEGSRGHNVGIHRLKKAETFFQKEVALVLVRQH